MRYTGPRNKLARREGVDLELKTPGSKAHGNLLRRLNIIPGQHGAGRARKKTDYGYQLREKQKLRRIYSISERQMKRYFEAANSKKGNTADYLIQNLERRLDNVIYRLSFAPTRAAARQLVGHGHVTVNKKKVTIPSYQVKIGDEVTFRRDKTIKIPYIEELLQKKDAIQPEWLQREGTVGKVAAVPLSNLFAEIVNLQSVIEFYSR